LNEKKDSPGPLVLGIDTGGTYTDGILLDYHTRAVLAAHKSLTTKRDLSIGIEAVIKNIPLDDPSDIKMVSISTTLATNAIAEGKSKRVALFLLGYDPELIETFSMQGRLATPNYYYFDGGHDLYGRKKMPLDLPAIKTKVHEIKERIDAIAVSGYFSPLNSAHEHRVHDAIAAICDLPVVLGHQLSTKLDSVERATTAALNASLLAVLQEFVLAVRRAMQRRRIEAPLMVVRGDGTLMSEEFAARTPVETIHSGPAASAIAGRFLTQRDDALVVDVGGTTTDIALIQNGRVVVNQDGATVNNFKTAVKAANIFSIALGGDSHIARNREKEITVGPERVVPLAYLAHQYPKVLDRLSVLSQKSAASVSAEWLEYWFLLREPQATNASKKPQHKALIDLLRQGPRPLPEIMDHLKVVHVAQIDADVLLRQEIIAKSGLTPTDLLHVEGRYTPWSIRAARLALEAFCRLQLQDPAGIRRQVWSRITETIASAVLALLTAKKLPPVGLPDDDMGRWFFRNSLYAEHPQLETRMQLKNPIIGIGAPAGVLLAEVARVFHTDLILPDHHAVANAVGAVAGSVMVVEEILVYPQMAEDGFSVVGYFVQSGDDRMTFGNAKAARSHARSAIRIKALDAARRSGADTPQVIVEEKMDGLDSYRIQAKAMGNPRLMK
jgi:N-methylhydantoinase A/oxoprolinase/acetone carboxylase beta subunit